MHVVSGRTLLVRQSPSQRERLRSSGGNFSLTGGAPTLLLFGAPPQAVLREKRAQMLASASASPALGRRERERLLQLGRGDGEDPSGEPWRLSREGTARQQRLGGRLPAESAQGGEALRIRRAAGGGSSASRAESKAAASSSEPSGVIEEFDAVELVTAEGCVAHAVRLALLWTANLSCEPSRS